MAWDDRRRTFRAPAPEPRLSVPQRYFRAALWILGPGFAIWLAALFYLCILARGG